MNKTTIDTHGMTFTLQPDGTTIHYRNTNDGQIYEEDFKPGDQYYEHFYSMFDDKKSDVLAGKELFSNDPLTEEERAHMEQMINRPVSFVHRMHERFPDHLMPQQWADWYDIEWKIIESFYRFRDHPTQAVKQVVLEAPALLRPNFNLIADYWESLIELVDIP